MTFLKKAAAASKAADQKDYEKPYVMVEAPRAQGPGVPLRHITSAEVKTEHDPPTLEAPRRGPMTGSGSMGDARFIEAFATPDELAAFRAAVEARRVRDPKTFVFMKCDNARCSLVMEVRPDTPEGTSCIKCNWTRRQDLGHMRRMSDPDIKAYLIRKAEQDKTDLEGMRRSAFYAENARRGPAGLPPLTFEEFMKKSIADHQEMAEQRNALGRVVEACRRRS